MLFGRLLKQTMKGHVALFGFLAACFLWFMSSKNILALLCSSVSALIKGKPFNHRLCLTAAQALHVGDPRPLPFEFEGKNVDLESF